jgi:hypothetical protein
VVGCCVYGNENLSSIKFGEVSIFEYSSQRNAFIIGLACSLVQSLSIYAGSSKVL